MRDAQLIAHPVHVPGHCFGCGASEGPVVDTMVDLVGDGRIYLCVRTCLASYARLAGWSDPREVAELVEEAQRLDGHVRGLLEQLEWERANKVVAVSDMAQLIDRMRSGALPATGAHVHFPQICSEMRVDGSPCSAEVLPGRDVCLAHSKRRAGVA